MRIRTCFFALVGLAAPAGMACDTVTFEQAFGDGLHGEAGADVEPTQDGGYLLAGQRTAVLSPTAEGYLVRTNALGAPLWTRPFTPDAHTDIRAALAAPDGTFVLTGSTGPASGDDNLFVSAVGADGSVAWEGPTVPQAIGRAVVATADGGYLAAGETLADGSHGLALEVDAAGGLVWSRTYLDAPDTFGVTAVAATSGTELALYGAGYVDGEHRIVIVEIDGSGDVLEVATLPRPLDWPVFEVVGRPLPSGGHVLAVLVGQPITIPPPIFELVAYVLGVADDGSVEWSRELTETLHTAGAVTYHVDLEVASDGSSQVLAAGLLVDLDPAGSVLDVRVPGTTQRYLQRFDRTDDGGLVFAGSDLSGTLPMQGQAVLVKTDAAGQVAPTP